MTSLSLEPQTSREIVRGKPERAVAISRLLREASDRVKATTATTAWQKPDYSPLSDGYPGRRGMLKAATIGFVPMVLIPAVVSAIYLFLIASDQYATEVSFAVRGSQTSILESVGSNIAANSSSLIIQDAMILENYVLSRNLVEDLQRRLNIREMYSRPSIDYWWRFNPKKSVEDLVEYWQHRSQVSIDPISGVVTVIVTAFTPQDSYEIAKAVIASSEDLVNKLTERSRADALKLGKQELARSEKYLQEKVDAMRAVRESDHVIDANQMALTLTTMIKELRLNLIGLEQDYGARLKSISPDAPQMKYSQAQIKTLRDQIAKLEAQLTSTLPQQTGSPTVASALSNFDKAQLERTIAQQQYTSAAIAHDRARIDLETQQVYVATFVKPVLPDEALYPRRGLIWSGIAAGCFLLWGLCFGGAVFVRNHFDV